MARSSSRTSSCRVSQRRPRLARAACSPELGASRLARVASWSRLCARSCSRRSCSAPTSSALIWLLAVVVALTALLRAIVNARQASTAPSRFFGTALACPASTARAAASASTGSLLPLRRRFARSGRLTSMTVTPAAYSARVSWYPLAAGAFDVGCHRGSLDRAPGQQLRRASIGGRDLQGALRAAEAVEDNGDVRVLVGVDPQDGGAVRGQGGASRVVGHGRARTGVGQDTHGAGARPLSG